MHDGNNVRAKSVPAVRKYVNSAYKLSDLLDQIREKCTTEVYELLGSKVTDYKTFRQKARDNAKTVRPLITATP